MSTKAISKQRFLILSVMVAVLLFLFAIIFVSVSGAKAQAPTPGETTNPYVTVINTTTRDGTQLTDTIIHGPPTPPPGFEAQRAAVTNLPEGATMITTPEYTWVYGCSAVSAAMIAGYYDRNGYPYIYTGPTDGGVMPLTDGSWPTWSDGYTTYPNNPLIASHNGVDGRTIKGSIDDYWVKYGSTAQDPYITGSWTQHAWYTSVGDFMKTSQSAYGNTDGSTQFYTWTTLPDELTCADMVSNGIDTIDGTYGRKLFYEARGYTVTDCYNQQTDNNVSGGFSMADFRAQIDAGHPVLLNLAGHSIVGVGYNSVSSNTIYVHDTWDTSTHTMTWGTSYLGMELLSVSIVNLSGNLLPTTTGLIPSSAMAGGVAFTLTVNGINFVNGSTVQWNGSNRTTTYVSSTQLTAEIPATDIAVGGTASVTVFNDTPGGGTSNAQTFTINNHVPTTTGLIPSSATAGGAAFTLTVNGINFVNGSTVRWNGSNRTTTYVSSTQLTAEIPATDIAVGGTASVTVFNGTPGGGTSNAQTFTIVILPPTNLQASDGTYTTQVLVTWTASSGATSYKVYHATSASGTKSLLGSPTGTTFNDTSATPGITYRYWVVAYRGISYSAYSVSDTGWRKLSPPTNLQASDGTYTTQVLVTWTASSGATSYKVYRAASATGTKTLLGSPTGTTFNDTSVTPGVTYYYWVVAYRGTSYSAYSAPNSGWRKLSPPTNVQASDGTYTTQVLVTWTASSGATSYKVYRALSATGTRTLLGSPTGTTFNDTSATPGVHYYYWVVAYRGSRYSAYSYPNSGWRMK